MNVPDIALAISFTLVATNAVHVEKRYHVHGKRSGIQGSVLVNAEERPVKTLRRRETERHADAFVRGRFVDMVYWIQSHVAVGGEITSFERSHQVNCIQMMALSVIVIFLDEMERIYGNMF